MDENWAPRSLVLREYPCEEITARCIVGVQGAGYGVEFREQESSSADRLDSSTSIS